MNEWGTPDWRDPSAYKGEDEDGHEWTMDCWRWEFLRRRADYRDRFFEAVDALPALPERPSWISSECLHLFFDGVIWPFEDERADDFCLGEFFDPRQSEWLGLGPRWEVSVPWVPGLNCEIDDFQPDFDFIGFDLREPLGPQLETARRWLELGQEAIFFYEDSKNPDFDEESAARSLEKLNKAPKWHRSKWGLYLRVMDARDSGASWSEISEILPEHMSARTPQAARNVFIQAQKQAFSF